MATMARDAANRISGPIRTGDEYIDSLRGRDLKVYLFGELIAEPVDHPMIRPSINALASNPEEIPPEFSEYMARVFSPPGVKDNSTT
jgi:hypothetical protein